MQNACAFLFKWRGAAFQTKEKRTADAATVRLKQGWKHAVIGRMNPSQRNNKSYSSKNPPCNVNQTLPACLTSLLYHIFMNSQCTIML